MAEQTWRLVPVEATDAMLGAGWRHVDGMASMPSVWRAMIEAAPTPPAPQAMPPVTLPEPAAWALCMNGHLVAFASVYEKAAGQSPGCTEPLYTADQLRIAIADDRKLRGGE